MSDQASVRISKLDAAKRQLREAIKMWFTGGDPVVTHTLAYAAYDVLHDVSKARDPNRPDLLFDSTHVAPEKRKEFNGYFRAAGNFFKHADRDAHAVLVFSPGITQIFLHYAVCALDLCGESLPNECIVFTNWMQLEHPELMPEKAKEKLEKRIGIEGFANLRTVPKHEYFKITMQTLRLTDE